MMKQFTILIALSFLIVLFSEQIRWVLNYLDNTYDIFHAQLSQLFGDAPWRVALISLCTLVALPFLITAIPGGFYSLIKKKQMPYFYHCVWFIWILLFTSISLVS